MLFQNLFTDKFYRFGVTVYDKEKNNISFWTSLLTLLDKQFLIPYNNDELILVKQFKEQILEMYKKANMSSFLKDYEKIDMRERFKLEPDLIILQYIVDMLDINFIVLDFDSFDITTVYKKDVMNPWKQTLLFAKSGSFWEPILMIKVKGETQRLFDYNNMNVKKILLDDIKYYNDINIKKDYICMDNIYDIVNCEKTKLNINVAIMNEDSDSSVKTEEEIFVNEDIVAEYKNMNKTKLNKMKVGEVVEIFKKLKLDTQKENPTKPIMIDMILNKIK